MKRSIRYAQVTLALLVAACLLAPDQIWAQKGTGNVEVRFEDTDPTNFPTISTLVTVLDPEGLPITGLDASNFSVFEDGQQVPVSRVDPVVNPDVKIAVALVIDISGSMYGTKIQDAKAAASTFVSGLGPNDLVAVIGFRGKDGEVNLDEPFPQINPDREIDFTNDKTQVQALIDLLDVPSPQAGRTPLYDGLFKAIRMTSSASGVDYRLVMAFTDGNEKCKDCGGSVLKQDDPITRAQKDDIPVFTIGVGEDADESYLKRVALVTGGTYDYAPTADKLAEIYQGVADQVKQQYLITYKAKAPADGKEHKLDVKVTTPDGEGSNVIPIEYPCPQKPGVRLFYLKPSDIQGRDPTEEPLEDGQVVEAKFTVVPDINACNPIARVELYVDDELIFTAEDKPFQLSHDFIDFRRDNPGMHRLSVLAYDDVGNISDQVGVTIEVPGLPGVQTPTPRPPGVPTVGPTRSMISIGGLSIPPWLVAVVGLLLILLLLVAILLLTRRKPTNVCPNCGQVMDPSWSECLFCAGQRAIFEDETAPEQPVFGYVAEDGTLPEVAALPPIAPTAAPMDMPTPYAGPEAPPPVMPVPPVSSDVPPPAATVSLRREPQRLGWLIVEQGERVGKEFRLQEGDSGIGRAGTNDVVLSDATVSRQHAKIRLEADGYYLYDLAATNPTLVNGQEIARHQLREGDRVQVGNVVMVFKEMDTG
jgi:VWFA-related protein